MSLLRQAHCEGRIDLRDADPYDWSWWKKVAWTLDWQEKENSNRIYQLKYLLHCSLLDYWLDKTTMDLHWDQAAKLQGRIANNLLPWLRLGEGPTQEIISEMSDQWKLIWGDPQDPKVVAEINKTVEHLLSMNRRNQNQTRTRRAV